MHLYISVLYIYIYIMYLYIYIYIYIYIKAMFFLAFSFQTRDFIFRSPRTSQKLEDLLY